MCLVVGDLGEVFVLHTERSHARLSDRYRDQMCSPRGLSGSVEISLEEAQLQVGERVASAAQGLRQEMMVACPGVGVVGVAGEGGNWGNS